LIVACLCPVLISGMITVYNYYCFCCHVTMQCLILQYVLIILLRVYQSIYIETSVRNKCQCSFSYCMSTDPLLQYVNM
jgi:hypothetical protein